MSDSAQQDKPRHTPGPWETSLDGIWGMCPWNARFKVATVTTPSPMNGIDWQANARLIAAAPDLLSVADGAPIMSAYHGASGFEVDRFITDYEAWRVTARAALAKAGAA